jgi:hypothetical protein
MPTDRESLFWPKVDIRADDQCWPWTRSFDRRGYGQFYMGGYKTSAHRAAWIFAHGDIEGELTVDHLCFNTACCNPAHLRLLSRSENSANRREAFKTHCAHGHEFDEANTYRIGTRRCCRACNRQKVREYKQRKRTA